MTSPPPFVVVPLLIALLPACAAEAPTATREPRDWGGFVHDDDDDDDDDDDGATTFDTDGDGYSEAGGDCDDSDPEVHPGVAIDGCGGGDEDCDGLTDEDAPRPDALPPGDWTHEDAHAEIVDPDQEWFAGSGLPARGAPGITDLPVRTYRMEGQWSQEYGVGLYPPPRCPGAVSTDTRKGFMDLPPGRVDGRPGKVFDLNGDGQTDIQIHEFIRLGPIDGDMGSFGADIVLPQRPSDVAVGDLDQDGAMDLVATLSGVVRVWPGPLGPGELQLSDSIPISPVDPGTILRALEIIPDTSEGPILLVGAAGTSATSVWYFRGMPRASGEVVEGALDLSAWDDSPGGGWGSAFRTDGAGRACLGKTHVQGTQTVICGSWEELLAGTGPIEVQTRDPRVVDMTPTLIAVGDSTYYEPPATWSEAGRILVLGPGGVEWTIQCMEYGDCSGILGSWGVALVPDVVWPDITWLVTLRWRPTDPYSRSMSTFLVFALDTSGL